MPLPNFIIIGAMKAGTTTLHSNLKLHPEIGMSKTKEPNYFNRNYTSKSIDWYKQQFFLSKKINGEASPNYAKNHICPDTAERMFNTLPEAKIIYITRDPIVRIISHLHHNLYRDRLKPKDINKAVLEDIEYINTSSYYKQVQEFLKFYPKENFLFLTTEGLKNDLNGALNKICEFLEVPQFDFNNLRSTNLSSKKYLIKNYDFVYSSISNTRIRKLYNWVFYFVGKKINRPELNEETLQTIHDKLFKDIMEFENLSRIDTSTWKTFKALAK